MKNALRLISLALITIYPGNTWALEPLPEDLEIEVALSALPEHLRDSATVYALNPEVGYELAREGTNGFHTFVVRTDSSVFTADWDYAEYPEDIMVPIAFDEAGVPAQMQLLFDIAGMRAKGTSAPETKMIINQRMAEGYYPVPARAGVSYMLSPIFRAYAEPALGSETAIFNYPHYMFYAPGVTNEDIGAQGFGQNPFILEGGPHGYIIKGAGAQERAAITEKHTEMLDKLCTFNAAFCLPE